MAARERNGLQLTLLPGEQATTSGVQYRLIPSIWEGEDCDLLELMLDFYPHKTPERILDATVNARRFWRGSQRAVIGMDINPHFHPAITYRCLFVMRSLT
jgi:hypothetical protein